MFYNSFVKIDKTVLCYIKKDDSYLLMLRNKKHDDLNESKWIGVGGHIENGEKKEEAVIREAKEETGLDLLAVTYRGEILFINDDYQEVMYLFTSDKFQGNLIECDEGTLSWINKKDIEKLNLWEGDRLFLPKLINGNKMIKMTLIYKGKRLMSYKDESEE